MVKVVYTSGEPHISDIPVERQTDLVKDLEKLLEEARSGEVVGFVGVKIWRDECVGRVRCGTMLTYKVVGMLEGVKQTLLETLD